MANKVLIVDDEPFNLDLLEQELADYDYIIERAGDGVEALEKTASFQPDVILLDYMMPRMNGLEVVKQLRTNPQQKAIPVILLTAKATQEDKVAGLDAGADDYVTKPFDSFELLARLRAMMRLKEMHDTLEEWNRALTDTVKKQVDELERLARLKRYLSPQIAETILDQEDDLFKTHRREITIVFLDLRGFTAFSDNAEPEEVMDFLRHYHAEMGKLVFKYEGTLERFVGDGIVVIFNDPIPCDNHTQKAALMALDMRDRVKELRAAWLKNGSALVRGGKGRTDSYRSKNYEPVGKYFRRRIDSRAESQGNQPADFSVQRDGSQINSHEPISAQHQELTTFPPEILGRARQLSHGRHGYARRRRQYFVCRGQGRRAQPDLRCRYGNHSTRQGAL